MSGRSPVFASYDPVKVTQWRKSRTVKYHKFLVHKMLSHASSCCREEITTTPARPGLGIANSGYRNFLSRIQS